MLLLPFTDPSLHLVCFDWDRCGPDDYLGELLLEDLEPLADGKRHVLRLPLRDHRLGEREGAVGGALELELMLVT